MSKLYYKASRTGGHRSLVGYRRPAGTSVFWSMCGTVSREAKATTGASASFTATSAAGVTVSGTVDCCTCGCVKTGSGSSTSIERSGANSDETGEVVSS